MSRKRAKPLRARVSYTLPRSDDPVEALIARARSSRRKGDARAALVLLRQACALDEWRPRTYTIFGVELARQHHMFEAELALNQARWLRARAGDAARAASTARVAAELLRAAA